MGTLEARNTGKELSRLDSIAERLLNIASYLAQTNDLCGDILTKVEGDASAIPPATSTNTSTETAGGVLGDIECQCSDLDRSSDHLRQRINHLKTLL